MSTDKSIAHDLDRLDAEIQLLRVEFERFFNGASQIPPEELRNHIQKRLRHLRSANVQSATELFRLGSLEARFNTYNELFNRRLRDHEEGRSPVRAPVAPAARYNVERGVVLDQGVDGEAVEALYQGLHSRADGRPRFDLESFRSYLRRQVDTLQGKTGCQAVQFRLVEEEGKMKLKAKPLKGPQARS